VIELVGVMRIEVRSCGGICRHACYEVADGDRTSAESLLFGARRPNDAERPNQEPRVLGRSTDSNGGSTARRNTADISAYRIPQTMT